jgi:iron complex transport system substrate-binding protein
MVTLPAPAQRIVSMAPSNTEILFAVGAGGQVIGRMSHQIFPPRRKIYPVSVEVLATSTTRLSSSCNPTWCWRLRLTRLEQVKTLEDLGLNVLMANPTTLAELYDNLLLVGEITGQQTKATEAGRNAPGARGSRRREIGSSL